MNIISADTNLFLYAVNPDSAHYERAGVFFAQAGVESEFIVCELVLVELYMLLRNPAVLRRPLGSGAAAALCARLRRNPAWQHADYEPIVSSALWHWAGTTTAGFRRIIDARLAFTLRHHGVSCFATANTRHFREFGFEKVWNPLD